MTGFFAIQAGFFYTMATWLVARYHEAGLSLLYSNGLFSLFMLVGLPSSWLLPWLAQRFDIRQPLPAKNIDTGMGLERVAFIKQGVDNMYETDQVRPVLDRAVELSGRKYGAVHEDDVRFRVIADHVRSSLMLLSDGVRPSNEGRGYILRRLMRRTVRSMRRAKSTSPFRLFQRARLPGLLSSAGVLSAVCWLSWRASSAIRRRYSA